MCAASHGDLEIAKLLLNKERGSIRGDMVGPAVALGSERPFDMVKQLLENGAAVNAKDRDGSSVLTKATDSGHLGSG